MPAEALTRPGDLRLRNLRAAGLSLAGFAVFSGCDAVVKLLSQGLPVPQATFMIAAFACAATVATALVAGGADELRPRQPGLALARAGLLAVDTLLIYYAFARLDLAEAYVLAFLAPMLVALLAAFLLGERLSRNGWAGVILGFAGVVVALRPGAHPLNLGHVAAIASALIFALSTLLLRKIRPGESEAALVTVLLAVLMAVSLALTVAGGGFTAVGVAQLALAALAGGAMALGNLLLIRAGRAGPASIVAPCQYSQILWACLYGLVLFAAPVEAPVIGGGVIIIVAGWLLLR